MLNVPNEEYIHLKSIWNALNDFLDEKTKRLFAGSIVKAYGYGGTDLSHYGKCLFMGSKAEKVA